MPSSTTAAQPWPKPAIIAILAGLAGLAINLLAPIRGPFGLDLLLGATPAILLVHRGWGKMALLAFTIAASGSAFQWGHPWAALAWIAEGLCLIRLRDRLPLVLADFLFWLLLGGPFILLSYGLVLKFGYPELALVALKQLLNGVFCVGLAGLATLLLPTPTHGHPRPFAIMLAERILPLFVLPLIGLFHYLGQTVPLALVTAQADHADYMAAILAARPRLASPAADVRQGDDVAAVWRRDSRGHVIDRWCATPCRLPLQPERAGQGNSTVMAVPGSRARVIVPKHNPSPMMRWQQALLISEAPPARAGDPAVVVSLNLEPAVRDTFGQMFTAMATLTLTLGFMVSAISLLARRLVRPIAQIQQTVAGIPDRALARHPASSDDIVEFATLNGELQMLNRRLVMAIEEARRLATNIARLSQHAPIVLCIWRIEHPVTRNGTRLVYLSASPGQRLGLEDHVLEQPLKLLALLHPDDRDRFRTRVRQIGVAPILPEEHAEYRIKARDGRWRWIQCTLSTGTTEAGEREVIAVLLDISDAREGRLRIEAAERLALLGSVASSLAHELNQPLNVIRLAIDNSRHRLEAVSETDREYLARKFDRIDSQIGRASALLTRMRLQPPEQQRTIAPTDLGAVVNDAMAMVATAFARSGIELCCTDTTAPAPAMANRQELGHVLAALLLRVRDAITERQGNPGLHITIGPEADPAHARIAIRVAPHVPHPFLAGDRAMSRLGELDLMHAVIAEMGGELLQEERDGGLLFTIGFPAPATLTT